MTRYRLRVDHGEQDTFTVIDSEDHGDVVAECGSDQALADQIVIVANKVDEAFNQYSDGRTRYHEATAELDKLLDIAEARNAK